MTAGRGRRNPPTMPPRKVSLNTFAELTVATRLRYPLTYGKGDLRSLRRTGRKRALFVLWNLSAVAAVVDNSGARDLRARPAFRADGRWSESRLHHDCPFWRQMIHLQIEPLRRPTDGSLRPEPRIRHRDGHRRGLERSRKHTNAARPVANQAGRRRRRERADRRTTGLSTRFPISASGFSPASTGRSASRDTLATE